MRLLPKILKSGHTCSRHEQQDSPSSGLELVFRSAASSVTGRLLATPDTFESPPLTLQNRRDETFCMVWFLLGYEGWQRLRLAQVAKPNEFRQMGILALCDRRASGYGSNFTHKDPGNSFIGEVCSPFARLEFHKGA